MLPFLLLPLFLFSHFSLFIQFKFGLSLISNSLLLLDLILPLLLQQVVVFYYFLYLCTLLLRLLLELYPLTFPTLLKLPPLLLYLLLTLLKLRPLLLQSHFSLSFGRFNFLFSFFSLGFSLFLSIYLLLNHKLLPFSISLLQVCLPCFHCSLLLTQDLLCLHLKLLLLLSPFLFSLYCFFLSLFF